MRLKSLELKIEWPEEVPLNKLRPYLVNQLKQFGEPLRWSIASISSSEKTDHYRQLKIEAVLIIY